MTMFSEEQLNNYSKEELVKRTDLEEETIDDIIRILSEEFAE